MGLNVEKLIARLRAGLDGVTSGPWCHYRAPLRRGMNMVNEVQCSERAPVVNWRGFDDCERGKRAHARNAAHIARCSPDNITAIYDKSIAAAIRSLASEDRT